VKKYVLTTRLPRPDVIPFWIFRLPFRKLYSLLLVVLLNTAKKYVLTTRLPRPDVIPFWNCTRKHFHFCGYVSNLCSMQCSHIKYKKLGHCETIFDVVSNNSILSAIGNAFSKTKFTVG